jgi:ABC-type multidrug transport system ATPase subunit
MIRLERVSKRFGATWAVNDVSLDIPAGDSVALWGTNGAGKTTLIRCILGLVRCRGSITIGGLDARSDGKRARRLIGYVPQEIGFYDDLRVAEAVTFFARLKGLGRVSTAEVLASVGLSGSESKRIRELSGGMKQRLALGVALLGNPPVLILDEVTASLDACGREEFVALLSRLVSGGRTLLFASHRRDEVATLARRIVTLERGRIASVVGASDFVANQESHPVLHLHIAQGARAGAAVLLRGRGYRPQFNGVGLFVPVPPTQKGAPLRILAERGIAVDDFEVLTGAPAHPAPEVQQ